jgi:hypothetical protein
VGYRRSQPRTGQDLVVSRQDRRPDARGRRCRVAPTLLWRASEVLTAPGGQQRDDRLGLRAARHEGSTRGAGQPLRVVDHAQQRPLRRGLERPTSLDRPESDRAQHQPVTRTWSPARRVADWEADQGGRTSASTTDGAGRTRAPSPTPPPPRGRLSEQMPTRLRTPAAQSSRRRARHAAPGLRSAGPAPAQEGSSAAFAAAPSNLSTPPRVGSCAPWRAAALHDVGARGSQPRRFARGSTALRAGSRSTDIADLRSPPACPRA